MPRDGAALPRDAFLYGSVFMANAASLLLPGANLTNLIVLVERSRERRHVRRSASLQRGRCRSRSRSRSSHSCSGSDLAAALAPPHDDARYLARRSGNARASPIAATLVLALVEAGSAGARARRARGGRSRRLGVRRIASARRTRCCCSACSVSRSLLGAIARGANAPACSSTQAAGRRRGSQPARRCS